MGALLESRGIRSSPALSLDGEFAVPFHPERTTNRGTALGPQERRGAIAGAWPLRGRACLTFCVAIGRMRSSFANAKSRRKRGRIADDPLESNRAPAGCRESSRRSPDRILVPRVASRNSLAESGRGVGPLRRPIARAH